MNLFNKTADPDAPPRPLELSHLTPEHFDAAEKHANGVMMLRVAQENAMDKRTMEAWGRMDRENTKGKK